MLLVPSYLFVIFFSSALLTHASNPFSSNVVALNARNWRQEVEESPHGVLVNISAGVKGTIKIAYWDTDQQSRRPSLLGEIQGTPTIRFYKPKPKQKPTSHTQKIVLDYPYERTAAAIKKWLDEQMPNFVEPIRSGKTLERFFDKAARNQLPAAILFTSKSRTAALTKYLSTEFRRRLLLGEAYPIKGNKESGGVWEQYSVREEDLPVLLVFPVNATEPVRYSGESFSRLKLYNFLSTYALKSPVVKKKIPETPNDNKEDATKETEKPVHTEL